MISKSLDALVNLFNSSVDLDQPSLAISLLAIAFNPTAWNIVARNGAGPPCLLSSSLDEICGQFPRLCEY